MCSSGLPSEKQSPETATEMTSMIMTARYGGAPQKRTCLGKTMVQSASANSNSNEQKLSQPHGGFFRLQEQVAWGPSNIQCHWELALTPPMPMRWKTDT